MELDRIAEEAAMSEAQNIICTCCKMRVIELHAGDDSAAPSGFEQFICQDCLEQVQGHGGHPPAPPRKGSSLGIRNYLAQRDRIKALEAQVESARLEGACDLVTSLGLSTGHADNMDMLREEVGWQIWERIRELEQALHMLLDQADLALRLSSAGDRARKALGEEE